MKSAIFDTHDVRWQAVIENNSNADGSFFYAVITTGVYCNPSCASKLPNPANVEFFDTVEEAELAGYRPCKRCTPCSNSKVSIVEQKIIHACRIIEKSETQIKLHDLADQIQLSPYYFHRLFKKIVGVTPKQYASRHQSMRYCRDLKTSPSITDAIYSSGYGSSGSAYNKSKDQLAMKPRVYRKGGAGITITYGVAPCFLGWAIVAATDRGICAIEFGKTPDILVDQVKNNYPRAQFRKADSDFYTLIHDVINFIQSPADTYDLPLDIQGTAFQQKVWNVLRQIKPGETLSYTEVAKRIGNRKAVRAVASACGENKIAVLIPCHRVISKAGKVAGYRWGTDRKKKLLESEKNRIQSISGIQDINK